MAEPHAATVEIRVDGRSFRVPAGIRLAAALANLRLPTRSSVRGELRAPLCGMGICFECRVRVGERRLVRACMVDCVDGMEVSTRDA
ncbi:MAG: (2Fe-2S)-binding protein [Planctomycetes bacterium]|jgi:predicted molibdopterin-dependent oxidoreductase YjgC|nr:(2Fe-2S)-binding protein [Planctomycetota bacterium]